MEDDFSVGIDPNDIKHFLRGTGLIPIDEYYLQLKKILKKRRESSKISYEQIQRKLAENFVSKDDSSKNITLLCPRKRVPFSPVITRKRGKAMKKRTPSATQLTVSATPNVPLENEAHKTSTIDENLTEIDTIDYDQPLDLRVKANATAKIKL